VQSRFLGRSDCLPTSVETPPPARLWFGLAVGFWVLGSAYPMLELIKRVLSGPERDAPLRQAQGRLWRRLYGSKVHARTKGKNEYPM
jgi:hypothetical protein